MDAAPAEGDATHTRVPSPDVTPADETARSRVLTDADLLHHICSQLAAPAHLATLTRVNSSFRTAALSPLLPGWQTCDRAAFEEAGPPQEPGSDHTMAGALARRLLPARLLHTPQSPRPPPAWTAGRVIALLRCKRAVRALDLSGVLVEAPGASAGLVRHLPDTLQSLAIRECTQPDAVLKALLRSPRLPLLPSLTSLDLSGVATEQTLIGLCTLAAGRNRPATDYDTPLARAARMAIRLPALEQLSVGFHLFTALGAREGAAYLAAQCDETNAPRLMRLGCNFATDALPAAIDILCGVCYTQLFRNVCRYVVHPPQQPHISYELHTDAPPISSSVTPMDGDPTRLQCARGCHPTLWLVDGGSGHVTRLLGKRYAVACGPPVGTAGGYRPQLAMACRHGEADGERPRFDDVQDVFMPHLPVGRAPPVPLQ